MKKSPSSFTDGSKISKILRLPGSATLTISKGPFIPVKRSARTFLKKFAELPKQPPKKDKKDANNLLLLDNPAACRGHKTDVVSPVESRSITPQGGESVALPFG